MGSDLTSYGQTLGECFKANGDISFARIELLHNFLKKGDQGKYVGCVPVETTQKIYGIPNSAANILEFDPLSGNFGFFGELPHLNFSYTGGAYFSEDGCVYGFPRNSNKLLKINVAARQVFELDLHLGFDTEGSVHNHHYAGAIYGKTFYCAPRHALHVVAIDLLELCARNLPAKLEGYYNGALLHPSGIIVFIPHRGSQVALLEPRSDEIHFIGDPVQGSFFSGVTYCDGVIYSMGSNGVLKVDLEHEEVKICCTCTVDNKPITGVYGTKLHFNGKIYGIMGKATSIFEFNPETAEVSVVGHFDDGRFNAAKFAGASLLQNGDIFLVPAFGRFAAKYVFDNAPTITDEMRRLLYSPFFSTGY